MTHDIVDGPKLPTFSGNLTDWDAFIDLFNGTVRHRNDYDRFRKCLRNRYGMKEDPSVVRRNLSDIKQEDSESLEDLKDMRRVEIKYGLK